MGDRQGDEKKLQEYLSEKRLDDLFVEIVEELLLDAPDNPVQYMIDYLIKHYPNQARDSSFAQTLSEHKEFSKLTDDKSFVPEIEQGPRI